MQQSFQFQACHKIHICLGPSIIRIFYQIKVWNKQAWDTSLELQASLKVGTSHSNSAIHLYRRIADSNSAQSSSMRFVMVLLSPSKSSFSSSVYGPALKGSNTHHNSREVTSHLVVRANICLAQISFPLATTEASWDFGMSPFASDSQMEYISKLRQQNLTSVSTIKPASMSWPACLELAHRVSDEARCPDTCGLSMLAKARLFDLTPVDIVLKAVSGRSTYHDAEFHGREAMSYCLDLALDTHVVSPCVFVALSRQEVSKAVKSTQESHLIYNNTRCPTLFQNTTHFVATSSVRIPQLLHVGEEEWLEFSKQFLIPQNLLNIIGHTGHTKLRNLAEYAAFNFIANCMCSSHNHHITLDMHGGSSEGGERGSREENGGGKEEGGNKAEQTARWIAVDNDRCFVPENVAKGRDVPVNHRWRVEQWLDMVQHEKSHWPLELVKKVTGLAAGR